MSESVDVHRIIVNIILPVARRTIMLHGGEATYDQLVRNITLELLRRGLLHRKEILRLDYEKIFDRHFQRIGRAKRWRIRVPGRVSPLDYIPLDRRIEWLIRSLLIEKGGKARPDEIFCVIFTNIIKANTPENEEIMDVLRRIAEPIRENRQVFWKLKETQQTALTQFMIEQPMPDELKARYDFDHDSMMAALARIGKVLGYDIWIAEREVSRNNILASYRTINKLRIPGIDTSALYRIEEVDVIWLLRKEVPCWLIEIEHTTDIRSGIMRMANIIGLIPHLNVRFLVVIPNGKYRAFERVINEPAIQRLMRGREILCLIYSEVAHLLDIMEEQKIEEEDILSMCRRVTF